MNRIKLFLAILFLAYLCGAFYSVSFNIGIWSNLLRVTTILFGLFFAIVVCTFPFIDKIFD